MLGYQDCPVDETADKGESIGSGIEYTEEGAVLGCGMLTWWGQELLKAGSMRWSVAAVMRIVEVHEGPHLGWVSM